MKKEEIEAILLIIGCIVGAGVLALPYAISKAGVLFGVLIILIVGFIILLLNLYLGEVVLRTKKLHELTGYAEKYLGRTAKKVLTGAMIIGIVGALVAYIIGVGESLQALLGWEKMYFSLIFFAVVAMLIFFDLGAVALSEAFVVFGSMVVLFLIMLFSAVKFNLSNLMHVNISNAFFPYGTILFALGGLAVIPEAYGVLRKQKQKLKKCIIIGVLIPIVLYVLFSIIAIGVTGANVYEISTITLGELVGEHVVLLGNLFAVLAMSTSFLVLCLAFKWILVYDYCWDRKSAWFVSCAVPLVLFLIGVRSFAQIITITGAIGGGIEGIIVVLMFRKAKKLGERKPEFSVKHHILVDWIIIGLFLAGIAYTVWELAV